MRVAELRTSDRNPRTISTGRFENLKRSLQEDRDFLDARPLLVNSYPGRENIVIGGNMRLRAARDTPARVMPRPQDGPKSHRSNPRSATSARVVYRL